MAPSEVVGKAAEVDDDGEGVGSEVVGEIDGEVEGSDVVGLIVTHGVSGQGSLELAHGLQRST